jgi:flagellar basal-body rod protein FlgG
LQKIGTNLFVPEDAQAQAQTAEGADVKQGFLEGANVAAIKMMTEMIETLRMFESYQKAMKALDEANAQAIDQVGST